MQDTEFTTQDEKLVIRYLLGQLKGGKKTRFEERYFEEEAFFEYLCAVEQVLIDDFLQKRLSWWKRRLFKRAYESSPERRKRVSDAQQIMRALAPPQHSFWRSMVEFVRAQDRRTQMAVAFVAIAAVATPWVILAILQGQNRVAGRYAERLPTAGASRPSATAPGAIASFLLEPGTLRGGSQAYGRLVIPATANLIELRLALHGQTSDKEYRARLLEAGGVEILTESALTVSNNSGGPFVTVWLPAKLLTQTDYVVVLEGERSPGHFPEVGSYVLALTRK